MGPPTPRGLAVTLAVLAVLVCGKVWAATGVEAMVVGARNQPIAGAAVSVMVEGTPPRVAQAGAIMAQRNRSFDPGLLVVQTGSAVAFPNEDTVRHHVYSFSAIKPFEIKLYVGTPASPIVFDKPGTAVVGCNIHDQMVGYIHVVDTPYFAVTDAQGLARLPLPPGRHRLRAWHPDLSAESPGVELAAAVPAGTAALRATVRLPIE